jgi:hypothetical protein
LPTPESRGFIQKFFFKTSFVPFFYNSWKKKRSKNELLPCCLTIKRFIINIIFCRPLYFIKVATVFFSR